MQMRLAHVNEESFTCPAPAAVDAAPPPSSQLRQEEPKGLKGGSSRKRGVVFVMLNVFGYVATPN
eukprot:3250202-Alexandrium_andersonii.AAC.1